MIRSFLTLLSICLATTLMAQEAGQSPAPDQNPNFNISRQKYMSQKLYNRENAETLTCKIPVDQVDAEQNAGKLVNLLQTQHA